MTPQDELVVDNFAGGGEAKEKAAHDDGAS